MFNILHDSIFNPRGLLKQVNRSGWFVFLYLFVMALFMASGTIFAYLSHPVPTFDATTTGCRIADQTLTCDGANYDPDKVFYLYNIRVYFLDSSMTTGDITNMATTSIVVQNTSATLYVGSLSMSSQQLFGPGSTNLTLADGMTMFAKTILIAGIAASLIDNLLIITIIALISTLMFLRYRRFIRYRKLFKLAVFAVTPFALLITLYNILYFGELLFFIIGFVAYLPLFRLNREIYAELMYRQMSKPEDSQASSDDVVESYREDEVDAKDVDDESDDHDQE